MPLNHLINFSLNSYRLCECSRNAVLKARQANTLLSSGNAEELPTFLRNVGSNFLLKGNALQWEAQKGWRVLAHGGPFADWWPIAKTIRTFLGSPEGAKFAIPTLSLDALPAGALR